MLGRRSHGCPVDQQTHCGRSDLGGEQTRRPEHQRMTAAPISSPYGSRCTDTVACRAGSNAVKADVLWEETGVCTRGTAGVWVHASGERGAEITPGRASHSRRRRMSLKINDLSHSVFVNIKPIESITYAFYAVRNAASFELNC